MMIWLVIIVVSAALILGAALGLTGWLSETVKGFIIAVAGGALIISVVMELIEPAIQQTSLLPVMIWVGVGGLIFTIANYLIDEKFSGSGGSGLMLAVTLDGIPENLALGVALIGSGPFGAAALAGSILLSNLPEAAGSASEMKESGRSNRMIIAMWSGVAAALAISAIIGHVALSGVNDDALSAIRAFAAGTVVASLASEVFPDAYRNSRHLTGIAVTLGLIFAVCLHQLGG